MYRAMPAMVHNAMVPEQIPIPSAVDEYAAHLRSSDSQQYTVLLRILERALEDILVIMHS